MALLTCHPNTQGLRQEDDKVKASLENVVRLPKMKFKLKIDAEQRWHNSFQCIILLIFIYKYSSVMDSKVTSHRFLST